MVYALSDIRTYVFIGYSIVIYTIANISEMSGMNKRQQVRRIRNGRVIAQYRKEIELLKEQIGVAKSSLIKNEEEAELAKRAEQQV